MLILSYQTQELLIPEDYNSNYEGLHTRQVLSLMLISRQLTETCSLTYVCLTNVRVIPEPLGA